MINVSFNKDPIRANAYLGQAGVVVQWCNGPSDLPEAFTPTWSGCTSDSSSHDPSQCSMTFASNWCNPRHIAPGDSSCCEFISLVTGNILVCSWVSSLRRSVSSDE